MLVYLFRDAGDPDGLRSACLDFFDEFGGSQLVGREVVETGDGAAAQRLADVLDVFSFDVTHHHDLFGIREKLETAEGFFWIY